MEPETSSHGSGSRQFGLGDLCLWQSSSYDLALRPKALRIANCVRIVPRRTHKVPPTLSYLSSGE